jgi:uncharacterized protein DUF4304
MTGNPRRMRLTGLVRALAPCLAGWKVYGLALARETEEGLWQVIDFQLDKNITSWRFTISLGLYDNVVESLVQWAPLNTQQPTTDVCQLRVRLGELIDGRDRWWTLPSQGAPDRLTKELCSALLRSASQDLERLKSRQGIVDAWLRGDHSVWLPASRMVLAGLLKQVGRAGEAMDVAAAEVANSVGSPSEQWSKTVAGRLSQTAE